MKQTSTTLLTAVLLLLLIAGQRAQAQKATASATQTLSVKVPASVSVRFDNANVSGIFPMTLETQQGNLGHGKGMASGNIFVTANCFYRMYAYVNSANLTGTTYSTNTIDGNMVYLSMDQSNGMNLSGFVIAGMVGYSNKTRISPDPSSPTMQTWPFQWVFDSNGWAGRTNAVVAPAPDTYTLTLTVEVDEI